MPRAGSGAGNPVISEPSVGECEYNKQKRVIEWRVPVVDGDDVRKTGELVRAAAPSLLWRWTVCVSNADGRGGEGSQELKVKNADPDAFFPVRVTFASQTLFSGLTVDDVVTVQGGQRVPFSQQASFAPEEYTVA
jgi:hypothetical protein